MTKRVDSTDAAYVLYSIVPLEWIFKLGRAYGTLTYLTRRRLRRIVRRNLAAAFGATKTRREIDLLTRRFFVAKRSRGVLLAIAPRLTTEQMEALLPLEGLEHLDAALQQNRGVVLLGSHLNSLCLFNVIVMLRERGYDIGVVLAEPGDPWAPSALRARLARRLNTKPVYELLDAFYAQFNIRPIVRRLADNRIVAQTGDGLHSARFVEVDFLGRKSPLPTGMLRVAQVAGAVVVPIFQVGSPPDGLRILIEEPRTVARGEDQLQEAVAAYAKRLEHHLLQNVECWEHWLIEDTLATIASWQARPLRERYEV